jgi:hypothetical protein
VLIAAPVEPADADYRRWLEAREPTAKPEGIASRRLPQPFFPGVEFVHMSGWAQGGHRQVERVTFAIVGKETKIVVADNENLDDNGYAQRLKALWLCPLEHERAIRATQDIDKLVALVEARAKVCTALDVRVPPKAQVDAFAGFVAALAGGSKSMTVLKKQSELPAPLAKLFATKDGGTPHDAAWVSGRVDFAPFTATHDGKRFAGLGMAVTDDGALELIEVRVDPKLSVVRKSVAFTRHFIE